MDSIWTAIQLIKPNCFMASIDLKDAYYSVHVSQKHQKYLKFICNETLYKFTCFPNGLAFCPRKFTKLMKPVFSTLRQQGHLSSPYIDDSILIGTDYDECASDVIDTIRLLDNLGFVAHPSKSVLIPTQVIVFLGFVLNSVSMTVSLTPKKIKKLKSAVCHPLSSMNPTIREVAQVVGLIIASFPGVMYGPLHFRITEGGKSEALKQSAGNFEAHMCLTPLAKCELQIYRQEPQITVRTDASKQGWGCAVNNLATGGLWTLEESSYHINYLEMLAALFGLKAYKRLVCGKHVKVLVDNTTAQATINKMGTSHSPQLNTLTKTIWDWCITNNVWLTIARIPGIDNIEADRESRKSRRCTEWCLNKDLFRQACEKLQFLPNIDLFASRINNQVKPFVSYHPDPEALAVNAFHQTWVGYKFYAFPPFSIISQVLQKNPEGEVRRTGTCSKMDNANMVASSNADVSSVTSCATKERIHIISAKQSERETPPPQEPVPDTMSLIRQHLESRGLSSTVTNIMEASWRPSTRKQYTSSLSKWKLYCGKRDVNPLSPPVAEGINFLGEPFQQGTGYSGLNTARSALSSIITLPDNIPFGTHPLVCRFIKGVFEIRPSLPRYQEIWDVNTVLEYLKTLHPPKDLTLKDLTLKLTMLLALVSAQRCQTLQALSIENMVLTNEKCVFHFTNLLKTSRPGKHLGPLVVTSFTPDERLCVVTVLRMYLDRTKTLRGICHQLLISYQKPYKGVTIDTISTWLKLVLKMAGIDTAKFTGYSTRAASTSAANRSSMPIATILETAGWSNATTFNKFYNKPLGNGNNFGQLLLSSVTNSSG